MQYALTLLLPAFYAQLIKQMEQGTVVYTQLVEQYICHVGCLLPA